MGLRWITSKSCFKRPTYHAVPFAGLLVEATVGPVLHQLDGVVEAQDLGDFVDDVHAVPLIPAPMRCYRGDSEMIHKIVCDTTRKSERHY